MMLINGVRPLTLWELGCGYTHVPFDLGQREKARRYFLELVGYMELVELHPNIDMECLVVGFRPGWN